MALVKWLALFLVAVGGDCFFLWLMLFAFSRGKSPESYAMSFLFSVSNLLWWLHCILFGEQLPLFNGGFSGSARDRSSPFVRRRRAPAGPVHSGGGHLRAKTQLIYPGGSTGLQPGVPPATRAKPA